MDQPSDPGKAVDRDFDSHCHADLGNGHGLDSDHGFDSGHDLDLDHGFGFGFEIATVDTHSPARILAHPDGLMMMMGDGTGSDFENKNEKMVVGVQGPGFRIWMRNVIAEVASELAAVGGAYVDFGCRILRGWVLVIPIDWRYSGCEILVSDLAMEEMEARIAGG